MWTCAAKDALSSRRCYSQDSYRHLVATVEIENELNGKMDGKYMTVQMVCFYIVA